MGSTNSIHFYSLQDNSFHIILSHGDRKFIAVIYGGLILWDNALTQ